MEEIQQRSFSSSCMVFLMRRSMVVSHWSSREIVSKSFTCRQKTDKKLKAGVEVRSFAPSNISNHVRQGCFFYSRTSVETHRVSEGIHILLLVGIEKFLFR